MHIKDLIPKTLYENIGTEKTKNHFHSFPDEVIQKIFSYFEWKHLLSTTQVCRRWHQITLDSLFLSQHFPIFRPTHFSSLAPMDKILDLLNRYQGKEIEELDLSNTNLSSEQLKNIKTVKTKKFKLGIPKFSYVKFVSSVPLDFGIVNGFDSIFQALINQKLKIFQLSLQKAKYLTSEKFIEFVKKEGLASPCELNLTGCEWVNSAVIKSFIDAKVQFKHLNLSNCEDITHEDLIGLIQAGSLLPNCELLLEDCDNVSTAFLPALTAANIKLQSLSIKFHDDENHLAPFIAKGGLSSPCRLDIGKFLLKKDVLKALISSEVAISYIALNVKEGKQEKLIKLFQIGKWADSCELRLKGMGLDEAVVKALANSGISLHTLSLESDYFYSEILSQLLASQPNLVSLHMSYVPEALFTILAQSSIRLRELSLGNYLGIEKGIADLCAANVLGQLEKLIVPRMDYALATTLNGTHLKHLTVSKWSKDDLIKCFSDPNVFKHLHLLIVKKSHDIDDSCQKIIQEKRPNLTIYVKAKK